MQRLDILEKKEDILTWIQQKKSKNYICEQLLCKAETLDSYLEKWGINGIGIYSEQLYKISQIIRKIDQRWNQIG